MRNRKLQFSLRTSFSLMTLAAILMFGILNWPRKPTRLEIVEEFHTLCDDQKYIEAAELAEQGNQLYPDDEAIEFIMYKGRFLRKFATREPAQQILVRPAEIVGGFECLGGLDSVENGELQEVAETGDCEATPSAIEFATNQVDSPSLSK